ncbi:MAG: beta-lactamase family protein, partial [Pseudomonadota bacterium]|nr:beta-lactamase family protein [Pseudomonadota bacterium]
MRHLLLSVALAAAAALPLIAVAGPAPGQAEIARHAEQLMEAAYAEQGPGAALLVARGDEVLYRGARGQASVELGVPLSADHVFRIGSVTKQFAAAGLLTLVEAGKVSLDDPLAKYVKDFPNGAAITVRQLLDHTSGVKSYTSIEGVMEGPIMLDRTTAALIDTFKNEKSDFAPGEKWAYNNSGYVLLGAVIEAASGMPWHAYLDQALFQPLGLKRTRYGDDGAVIAGHVRGYSLQQGKLAPMRHLSMSQPHAAGALVSTVADLHRWNRALHEGRVLKDATYRAMITPVGPAKEGKYGFGIFRDTLRGDEMLAHAGGIHGFVSFLLYLPGSDITVAILQNADDEIGGIAADAIARKLAAAAIGNPYPATTPVAMTPEALAEVQGVYRIDEKTTRTLRVVDGVLTGQRTGGAQSKLIPIARDTFLYEDGFNRFDIVRDRAGAVTGMRFYAEGEGQGEVVPRSAEPLPTVVVVTLPVEAMARLAGAYAREGMVLNVFVEGEGLKAQMTGQPAFDLQASSPNDFSVPTVGAELAFAPGAGLAKTLTLKQGGRELEF